MRWIAIGLFLAACLALTLQPAAYADGLLAGAYAPGTARTYPGGAPCNTTLQACLSGSNNGDSITVLPVAYVTGLLVISHSLALQGAGAPTTTLRANGNHGVIRIDTSTGAGVVISGLRVISGNTGIGGGVYAPGGAPLTLVNMEVFSNHTTVSGGGIYAVGPITLVNVKVAHNTALSSDGGGLLGSSLVVISGGQFLSNTASQNGGAMRVIGPLTLNNVAILSNTATVRHGGGIRADSSVVMTGGSVQGNSAGIDGGGLYAIGSASILNTSIDHNQAAESGGGLMLSGTLTLDNAVLSDNQAIALFGGGAFVTGTANVVGGQLQSNTSNVRGGGLYVTGTLGISGTLLKQNVAAQGGGLFVTGTLALTNGQVISNFTDSSDGAGALVDGSGIVANTHFEGNLSILNGGALAGIDFDVRTGTFVTNYTLIGSAAAIFARNSLRLSGSLVQNGNAVTCSGVRAANLDVQATNFISNAAFNTGGGACALGSARFDGVTFQRNGANDGGGGLMVFTGTVTLTDTQFISNSATAQGGGIFAKGVVTLTRGIFERNMVSTTAGLGGGLSVSGTVFADGTRFLTNTAWSGGGAFLTGTLNLTNGAIFGGNFAVRGGGGADTDRLVAVNSVFISNTAGVTTAFAAGGGIAADTAALTGTQFIRNFAVARGGGGDIHSLTAANLQVMANATGGDGGGFSTGFARVDSSLFMSNTAGIFSGYGGGMSVGGTLSVFNSQFISNVAGNGGAFGVFSLVGGHLQLIDNHAAGHGGGAAVEVLSGSTINLTDSVFLRNSAFDGGGLYYQGNSNIFGGQIVNSLFAQNSASSATGAAEILQENPGPLAIVHDTFADRTLNAGAAIVNLTGTVGITDSIIVNHNIGISITGGLLNEDFNLYFGDPVGVSGPHFIGGHSIVGDPRFVDPAGDNYHLGSLSAAIDLGGNAAITTDIDGDARPFGPGFDMGYDESRWLNVFLPMITR